MTRGEAKREAYAHAALMLDSNLSSMDPPSEWGDDPMNEKDENRWYRAMYEIRDSLARRGGIEFKDNRSGKP